MGSVRRLPVVLAVAAATLAAAPDASAAGPIESGLANPASVKTLRPGVTLTTYTVTVNDFGVTRRQTIYKVAWTIGNTHVQLNAAPLGSYYSDDTSIRLNRISSWWSSSGLGSTVVAAVNGDFFADSSRHGGA